MEATILAKGSVIDFYGQPEAPSNPPANQARMFYNETTDTFHVIDSTGADILSGGGGGSLAGLSDVDLTSPSNDQVLTYDGSTSKWINASPTPASAALPFVVPEPTIVTTTSSDYTIQASDYGIVREMNSASDQTVTLDSTISSPIPFLVTVFATGGGNMTLAPSSGLVNGQALYKLFTAPALALSVVNTAGTAVSWVSGPQFTAEMAGSIVFIGPGGNGQPFLVQTFNSATSLTLAATAGNQSSINFTFNGNPCVGLAFDGTNWYASLVPPAQQPWIWIQDAAGHYRAAIAVDENTGFNNISDPTNSGGNGTVSFVRPVLFNPSGRTPTFGANGVWAVYYEPIINEGETYGLATQIETTIPVGSTTVYNAQITGLYSELDVNGNPTLESPEGSSCLRGTVSDLRGNNVTPVSSAAELSGISAAYDRNSTTLDMTLTTAASFSGESTNNVDGEMGSGVMMPVYRGSFFNFGNTATGQAAVYHAAEIGSHVFPEANFNFYSDGVASGDVHDFNFYAELGPSQFRSLALFSQIGISSDYVPTINDNFIGFSAAATCYLPIAYPLGSLWAGGICDTNGVDVTNPTGSFNFVKAMVGNNMTIAGVTYTVATFVSSTHITLTGSAGIQTGAAFDVIPTVPIYFDLYIANQTGNPSDVISIQAPLGSVQPYGNITLYPGQTVHVRVAGTNGTWYVAGNGGPSVGAPQFTVAQLPAGYEGATAYATNGLKVGETTGNGTGVPVYYSNSEWRVYSTDGQVQS